MNIKIECPSCKQQYSVDELIIGEEVECAVCNSVFIATKKAPIKLELPTINQKKTPFSLPLSPQNEGKNHSILSIPQETEAKENNAKGNRLEAKEQNKAITNNNIDAEYEYPWKKSFPLETEQNNSKLSFESEHKEVSKDNHTRKKTPELHSINKSKNKEDRGGSCFFSVLSVVLFLLYIIITQFIVKAVSHSGFGHIIFFILIIICIVVGVWEYFFSNKDKTKEKSVSNNKSTPKESGIRSLKNAAEHGDSLAQIILGSCYYEGKNGAEQSYTEAVIWFRKAAEQGNTEAQIMLAECFENGKGVEKNFSESIKWYRLAAEQGHAQAQLVLGLCYSLGDGVEKNMEEAKKWISLSASQGNKEAKETLRKLG